jgi:Protein of unknown function (DUF4254)
MLLTCAPFASTTESLPMLPSAPLLVEQITTLQREVVARWHAEPLDNPYHDLLATVCQQHQFNFQLWHQEDIARSPDVGDRRIAEVKRAIDRYNQQRNDWIERVDDDLIAGVAEAGVLPEQGARINTETPGAAIDRLSILSLRIYHLQEQAAREDVDELHQSKVAERLDRCGSQHAELTQSLTELLDDIFAGRKLLKIYRQMKMYNDATMNPSLYRKRRLVG